MTASAALPQAAGYRPEIDGLRAVAVGLVILFHMVPGYVRNGFIGVDIFFVISGFLITGIVTAELRGGRFGLVRFYMRRANRIFPALVLVLAASLAVGWFSLFAPEFQMLGRSAFAGASFGANINAYLEGGYWDIAASLKPLLHLWSLGVEEQFYLFWPLLLWAAWRRPRWLVIVLTGVLIASFGWNLWSVGVNQPAAFYLPFSRFWELAAGGLLAVAGSAPNARWRGMSALVGIGLIVLALLLPIPEHQFPGKYAVLPVLGTVLVIYANTDAWANAKILAWPGLVYVGLISFPLYMWHYPVFAFMRILGNGDVPTTWLWMALALTVMLSVMTYHLVEWPIRHNKRWRGTVALSLTGLLCASSAGGYAVYANGGFDGRYPHEVATTIDLPVAKVVTSNRLIVIGDSNAGHLTPGLGVIYGNYLEVVAAPGWPFLAGTMYRPDFPRDPSLSATPQTTQDGLGKIVADPTVDVVVLSNQYSMYTDQDLLAEQTGSPAGQSGAAVYESGLRRTLRMLSDGGKKVVVFKSIPTRGDVTSMLACASSPLPIPRRHPATCARALADIQRSRRNYDQMLIRSAAGIQNVWLFDPLPYLCDSEYCYIERNRVLLYHDMSHLTPAGSQIIGVALSSLVESIRSGHAQK